MSSFRVNEKWIQQRNRLLQAQVDQHWQAEVEHIDKLKSSTWKWNPTDVIENCKRWKMYNCVYLLNYRSLYSPSMLNGKGPHLIASILVDMCKRNSQSIDYGCRSNSTLIEFLAFSLPRFQERGEERERVGSREREKVLCVTNLSDEHIHMFTWN